MNNNSSLIEVLSRLVNNNQSNASFDGRTIRFNFQQNEKLEIESNCTSMGIPTEFYLNNQCEIRIDSVYNNGSLAIFFDENDFIKRGYSYFSEFENLNLIILKNEKPGLEKLPNETFSKEKSIFFNLFYYQKILSFLEDEEHFISVNDRADLQFIIFSSDKGPFHIGYNLLDPRIKNLENLSIVYDLLLKEFKKIDFVQFFKSAIINTIYEYKVEERFFYFVQSLRVILNIAQRDHYIYIRNFDFDKIKSKFQEGRKEYFKRLDDNIESINKQVASFPLTFAASVFAAYQVKEKPAILILIFMAYALYTLIAWKILNVTELNKNRIKEDIDADANKIKKNYQLVYSDFENDFQAIDSKIGKIEGLVSILRTVLLGLLLCFLIFGIYEIFFVE